MSLLVARTRQTSVWLFLLVSLITPAAAAAGTLWETTEWNGEAARSSSSAGWTAIVSVERARLVFLGPEGREENLLHVAAKDADSRGGHLFWLGPQKLWRWPPPADWETRAAERVEAERGLLRVVHAHTDPSYPSLTRSYEWREGVLHCTASWRDPRFQGIHILQIPRKAVVRVKRKVTDTFPLGYVLPPIFRRNDLLVDRAISPAVARIDGDDIVLRWAGVTEKIGVYPQDIVAEIGVYRLVLSRGETTGMSENRPDLGMFSQVFLGNHQSAFTEIEQLTPLAGDGMATSEILIKPERVQAPEKDAGDIPIFREQALLQ